VVPVLARREKVLPQKEICELMTDPLQHSEEQGCRGQTKRSEKGLIYVSPDGGCPGAISGGCLHHLVVVLVHPGMDSPHCLLVMMTGSAEFAPHA
jgi:hypothetical protein